MALEDRVIAVMEGRRVAPFLSLLLAPLSFLYAFAIFLKKVTYNRCVVPKNVGLYTISVGNIACGGSGKTPLVRYLADRFSKELSVAIVTRGYGGKETESLQVDPSRVSWQECGDEALWLARRVPEAHIYAGRLRLKSALLAQARGDCLCLLDDGLQQRSLSVNYSIICLHSSFFTRKDRYLPWGPLRDTLGRLAEANLIVAQQIDPKKWAFCADLVRQYTNAPLVNFQLAVEQEEMFRGKRVALFCAIGYPNRVFELLQELSCIVVASCVKRDHRSFSVEELELLALEGKKQGAECLVCTEKDAVKLGECTAVGGLSIHSIKMRIYPTEGREHIENTIKYIRNQLKEMSCESVI